MLACAEAALRIAGYGYDPHLFQKIQFHGHDYFVNNETFSRRFFPKELERWPSPILMPAQKAPGTFRIFIFGESAAQGDPEPSYGAARYMEALLRERYPEVNFEIENVGITAINSHVILPIARECAHHDGDLWLIYMGNNEMVGPFGAATVFGSQAPPLAFVRLSLALQRTRLGQALMDLGRRLRRRGSTPAQWGGMEMFMGNRLAPDDPRREQVYRNYNRNLRDIVRAGLGSGAEVVLSTVAVNLKDCPPFASMPPRSAEDEYANGLNLLASSNYAAAHDALQKACDDDALPFRADSRINGAIQQAAQEFAGPKLDFCDAARVLEAEQPDDVCGQETFYEHVHFNFNGGYRLGLIWAKEIEKFVPAEQTKPRHWATQETCDARLGLTAWNRMDTIHLVLDRMARPPLASQANNDGRVALLQAQLQKAKDQTKPELRPSAREVYLDAIRRAPDDYYLHEGFAEFDELTGDLVGAAEQWRQSYELMPRNPFAYFSEGQILIQTGRLDDARASFKEAIAQHPRYAEAWLALGKIDAQENRFDDAVAKYRHSLELQATQPEAWLCLGKAQSLQKHSADSQASFRRAIELSPSYWEAHYALGGELGMHDQFAAARTEFEQVVRLNPTFAMGHLNLGVALLKLNDVAGARAQFIETLHLDPANKTAPAYLQAAQSMGKQ
jgi:tetratricopeptide (TPR) repeat protein